MNIKEFKTWLEQFDDDVVVEVMIQEEPDTYQSYGACGAEEFVGNDQDHEYVDFNGNQFVKPDDKWYGKKYLKLGMNT